MARMIVVVMSGVALAVVAACGTAREAAAPPAVPPPVLPPPPSAEPPFVIADPAEILVCVLRDGALEHVRVEYDRVTGDTTYQGRPLREAFPITREYATRAEWYHQNEPIVTHPQRYVKYGIARVLGIQEIRRVGEHRGVPLFAEVGDDDLPDILYIPVRTGCVFQSYQLEPRAYGVRG
jgi:hypothetical protein